MRFIITKASGTAAFIEINSLEELSRFVKRHNEGFVLYGTTLCNDNLATEFYDDWRDNEARHNDNGK